MGVGGWGWAGNLTTTNNMANRVEKMVGGGEGQDNDEYSNVNSVYLLGAKKLGYFVFTIC